MKVFSEGKMIVFLANALLLLPLLIACDSNPALAKSKKGWLGVSVQEMTPSLRDEMALGGP